MDFNAHGTPIKDVDRQADVRRTSADAARFCGAMASGFARWDIGKGGTQPERIG
jgi:hypothetical protein